MKKKFIKILLVSFFATSVFTFGLLIPTIPVSAETMSVSQFVELLITIGAIPADKVVAARALAVNLSSATSTITSTPTIVATSSLPYIQVLSPNGGENWDIDVDVAYSITWGSTSKVPVNIGLAPGHGEVCNLTSTPVSSGKTTNTFRVLLKTAKCFNQITGTSSPVIDGTYKVRVSYTNESGKIVSDDSDKSFKILPVLIPSMKVTYPNGSENLIRNREYTIKYTLTNFTKSNDDLIYYYLLDNDGNIVTNGRKVITTARNFVLDIPSNITANAYKIKLKLTTNEHVEIEDTSDNFFWISSAY
jgi:hypothetical protein